jgi:hypothetical protein
MGWGGASSPGGGADSSPDAPGGGLGSGAFGGDGPSVSGQSKDFGNTVEGFRAALAKALGQVTQEQKDKAVEAQKNLEAKNQESLTKKTGISVAKTTEQISKEQQLQNLIDKFDPKAKVKHNPHLESLEPGAYDANVSLDLDQQLDLGLISQFEYDATKAMINQEMPIGKNIDLGIKNMPAVNPDVEDVNQEKRGAFRNISYGSFPSAVVDNGLLGAAIDDPQGTQKGLDAEQAARDAMESSRDVNKNVDIGIGPESFTDPSTPSSHPSRDTRIGMPFGVGRPAPTDQQENREPVDMYGRVTEFENIDDPERKAAAYKALAQLQKQAMEAQTPLGRALRSIFGMMEYGTVGTIGKAMKAALDKLGFNVDPNIIGQAMAIAHESVTQGPMGPGGVSIGSRNDNFLNEFLRALPGEEPWMKGLSQSQIDYYLNDPDELDWVRNLYKNMNP